jgi:hypothetical protein
VERVVRNALVKMLFSGRIFAPSANLFGIVFGEADPPLQRLRHSFVI